MAVETISSRSEASLWAGIPDVRRRRFLRCRGAPGTRAPRRGGGRPHPRRRRWRLVRQLEDDLVVHFGWDGVRRQQEARGRRRLRGGRFSGGGARPSGRQLVEEGFSEGLDLLLLARRRLVLASAGEDQTGLERSLPQILIPGARLERLQAIEPAVDPAELSRIEP